MKLKLAMFASYLAANLLIFAADGATALIGKQQCLPYASGDSRTVPKGSISAARLISKGTGYTLILKSVEEYEIPLDSKMHLASGQSVPYTMNPLSISPNGKFSITILYRRYTCTYSGKAKISAEAYKKLFGNRSR
jgi:hypothetical protein